MALYRRLRAHQIFGGGTAIGKTIISSALCKASVSLGEQTAYLKPIGTGSDSDDRHVQQHIGIAVDSKCLYTFDEPVSPHLAAERLSLKSDPSSPRPVIPTDQELVRSLYDHLSRTARALDPARQGALYIESAGGVHSPTLAGTSQLLAYRSLRLPTLLIGSPLLGGISSTVSAYESLLLHGYDVDGLAVLKEDYYQNYRYLARWSAERGIPCAVIDPPPAHAPDLAQEHAQMVLFYESITVPDSPAVALVRALQDAHCRRLALLDSLPERAHRQIWWPFLQHSTLTDPSQVTVIDSAHKDWMVTNQRSRAQAEVAPGRAPDDAENRSLLRAQFDGSASWWTQAVGHADATIALSAAHAAGRYGHVLFPGCIHEPALGLSERLLRTVGHGWADRVFFSDNGSTGVEVALKMALGAFSRAHGLRKDSHGPLGVLGLKGSYHGDTIGAMDASERSLYNAQVDWYSGKGLWLDAPQVKVVRGGQAVVEVGANSQWGDKGWRRMYESVQDIYDVGRRLREDSLAGEYRAHILAFLQNNRRESAVRLGCLIIEPVVMGAGGMVFVDPLFQSVLIQLVRTNADLFGAPKAGLSSAADREQTKGWAGLPVIFDEVFSGLYRLGRASGAAFLGPNALPDIGVYSKMLTAGTVPLSATLAREEVFDAFRGPGPESALLHGHSYTAHPVGCAVAEKGMEMYEKLEGEGAWDGARSGWGITRGRVEGVWSFWSMQFVDKVCEVDGVEGAMSLGTVVAIYLKDERPGYGSQAARRFLDRLQAVGISDQDCHSSGSGDQESCSSQQVQTGLPFAIHGRPLGNVVYFICSLNSCSTKSGETGCLEIVEKRVLKCLSEMKEK